MQRPTQTTWFWLTTRSPAAGPPTADHMGIHKQQRLFAQFWIIFFFNMGNQSDLRTKDKYAPKSMLFFQCTAGDTNCSVTLKRIVLFCSFVVWFLVGKVRGPIVPSTKTNFACGSRRTAKSDCSKSPLIWSVAFYRHGVVPTFVSHTLTLRKGNAFPCYF